MQRFNQMAVLAAALVAGTALIAPAQAGELDSSIARLKPVSTTYMLEGVVEAELNTTISAQTAGKISQIYFDVNDYVNKNEIVVEIDNQQQLSALQQAEASLKEAKARRVEAESEYDRIEKVYAKNVVSKADFDKVKAALEASLARVESATAAAAQARQQFEYTVVRAPFSGILTERMVEPGETVNVGTQLVSGVSLEKMRVLTHVPQSMYKAVREHRHAIVVSDDSEIVSDDMTFFPFADARSHSFALRVRLPDTYTELRPGMNVKVAMEVAVEDKVVVPFSAVAFRSEVTGIYLLENDQLKFRHIRLGRRLADNEVVVVAGLEAGERVLTDPVAAAVAIKQKP